VDDRYLELGLAGMAAAGEPFMAHFGAAVLAGWWLDHEHGLEPVVAAAMTGQVDRMIAKHGWLFSGSHAGPSRRDAADELLTALDPWLEGTWAIGHDVIYVALVLRTLAARPGMCSDAMLDGLHRVLDACHELPLLHVASRFDVSRVGADDAGGVDVDPPAALARVALETAVGFEHVYPGLHAGHIGHILDHGHAVLVLEALGHDAAASRARRGFLQHVAALRHVWHATMESSEAPAAGRGDARTIGYWTRDLDASDWAVGHAFKYPYALFDLVAVVDDPGLASAAARRVLQLV
jgi:hypothetical protein